MREDIILEQLTEDEVMVYPNRTLIWGYAMSCFMGLLFSSANFVAAMNEDLPIKKETDAFNIFSLSVEITPTLLGILFVYVILRRHLRRKTIRVSNDSIYINNRLIASRLDYGKLYIRHYSFIPKFGKLRNQYSVILDVGGKKYYLASLFRKEKAENILFILDLFLYSHDYERYMEVVARKYMLPPSGLPSPLY